MLEIGLATESKQTEMLNKLENLSMAIPELPLRKSNVKFKEGDISNGVIRTHASSSNIHGCSQSLPFWLYNASSSPTAMGFIGYDNTPMESTTTISSDTYRFEAYYDDGYIVQVYTQYYSSNNHYISVSVHKVDMVNGVAKFTTFLNRYRTLRVTGTGASGLGMFILRDGQKIALVTYGGGLYASTSSSASKVFIFTLPTKVVSSVSFTTTQGADFSNSSSTILSISSSDYIPMFRKDNQVHLHYYSSSTAFRWANVTFDGSTNTIKVNAPASIDTSTIKGSGSFSKTTATSGPMLSNITGSTVSYNAMGYAFVESTSHSGLYLYTKLSTTASYQYFAYKNELYQITKNGSYGVFVRKFKYNPTTKIEEYGESYFIETMFTPNSYAVSTFGGQAIIVGKDAASSLYVCNISAELEKVPNIK